jgi:alpha-D-xyloside xylohydrolase
MLKERVFNIVMVGKDRVRPLNLDNPEGVRVSYDGRRVSIAL